MLLYYKSKKQSQILFKERVNNKLPLYPCSFTATLPIFFVAMHHIVLQKIVDWQLNSGG
jgi:hypothetical protein